uniref:Uncharacterized protein n=1 Tax=Lepeophtheirus salmonis TaxID=72036 RepID=A0A0K2U754_LEPSM
MKPVDVIIKSLYLLKRVSVHPVNLEHRSILYLVANEVNHKSFGVTQLSYNVLEVAYMLMKYNDTSLLSNS